MNTNKLSPNQFNKRIGPLLKILMMTEPGSRRKLAGAILQGKVCVNGNPVTNLSHPVNLEIDTIAINGNPVDTSIKQRILLMLNKPAGILSTTKDEKGRKTVIDILPTPYRNAGLYPVGRLDKNSTGLLLLTNDGDLTYRITHPKFEHEKEYLIYIRSKLKADEIARIKRGIQLDDGITYPASIKNVKGYHLFNYSIIIHEGRKRQVHRMFEELGHRVLALKRIRIGNLKLGNLKEGEVRELSYHEIKRLPGYTPDNRP